MQSYLLEITADIFAQKDDLTSNRLIDMILDISRQNGTGKWTSQSAMDLFVPVPAIDAAVTSRDMSVLKKDRSVAEKELTWFPVVFKEHESELINWVGDALYFSMIIAYAQGFALLQKASSEFQYDIKLDEIARIWRGGCIIRSTFLDEILKAFKATPDLPDILLNDNIGLLLETCQDGMRLSIKTGVDSGVPMPVMMASLAYFDSYRSARLPANLIQAQRDYFGAHTYERTDREGIFHTEWNQTNSDGSKQ
jgi:6-phosphogluconate dehydrogenase